MEGKRVYQRIRAENFLSFGKPGIDIRPGPLNILIGPNAAGKSNFIDLLRSLRVMVDEPVRLTEGSLEPRDLTFCGADQAWISCVINGEGESVSDEFIDNESARKEYSVGSYYTADSGKESAYYFGRFDATSTRVRMVEEQVSVHRDVGWRVERELKGGHARSRFLKPGTNSVQLVPRPESEFEDFISHPALKRALTRARFYSSLGVGRDNPARIGSAHDSPSDFLDEDGSNVAKIISEIGLHPRRMERLEDELRKINPRIRRITTRTDGSRLQLYVTEQGNDRAIPARRFSDGTIRYLCMLAVLLHPTPPEVIAFEDPEIGLHPEAILNLGPLLVESSQRSQIFVATHSEAILNAVSHYPECVWVCSHDGKQSHLRQLDPERLRPFLEIEPLGSLWAGGFLGGNPE